MRWSVLALVLCAGFAAAQTPPPAPKPALPGQDAVFKTQDGWTIEGKYVPAQDDKRTLLLLPGRGQTIGHWKTLAAALAKAGYGYLAIDLRGHGQSNIGPDGLPHSFREFKAGRMQNDWEDMRFDVQAAFDWLKTQGVSEDRTGIVGDDVGGSVGLKFAAVHPSVALVVWLTPGMSWEEVLTVNAMRAYKNRPILMIYSDRDKRSARETPILYNFARLSAGDQNSWAFGVPNVQGYRLAHYGPVVRQIVAWIGSPVKPEAPAVSTGPLPAPATGPAAATQSSAPDSQGQ